MKVRMEGSGLRVACEREREKREVRREKREEGREKRCRRWRNCTIVR